MKFQSLLFLGSMFVLGAVFTSCSKDKDLYDSGAEMEKLKSEYTNNFVKKYGPIDSNQTWDFTSMSPVSTLPSTGNMHIRHVPSPA